MRSIRGLLKASWNTAEASKTGHLTETVRCRGFVGNLSNTIMTLGTILLIIVVLMLLGTIPTWPHSRNWGYGPSGGLGLILIILIVLFLLGRI